MTTITLRCRVCEREQEVRRVGYEPADAVIEERTCGLHVDPNDPSRFAEGDCGIRWIDAAGNEVAASGAGPSTDGEERNV